MAYIRKKNCGALLFLIPPIFSVACVITERLWLIIPCIISLFVIVATLPLCRKRESLWIFVGFVPASAPVNFVLALYFSLDFMDSYSRFQQILWFILALSVLLSIEGIIFGIITRLIWKEQYRIRL